MKITPITETFAVAAQPSPEEIGDLKRAHGTALLINNRPDGEEPSQPGTRAEAEAAQAAGIGYLHLPVAGASITREDVERFGQAVREAGGPVVAHCRGGTRSLTLWAIGEVFDGRLTRDELLDFGAKRGFDLTGAVRWLDENGTP